MGVLQQLSVCTCDGASEYKDHAQLLKRMQFVMGLDDVYAPIRSTILTTDPLPTVKEAFSLLLRDESHRTMHSRGFEGGRSGDKKRRFNNFIARNPSLGYKNYNMTGYTIKRCFKVIRYPLNFKKKGMTSQNVTSSCSMNDKDIGSGAISLIPSPVSGGNGRIYELEVETLGQILQWLIQNLNMMLTNSGGTPIDSRDQTFTYGMKFEIKMIGLNGNYLIVDLEKTKMNEDSLSHLKFDIWKWPKRRRKGAKCKVKNKGWKFDFQKWPKRKKSCLTKYKFEHEKWKFDVWRWPNKKKKLTHQFVHLSTLISLNFCMVIKEVSNHCRFLRARIFSRRMELWVEIMFCWNEVVNKKVSKRTTYSKQAIYQRTKRRRVSEKKGSLELVSLVGLTNEWVCRRLNVGWCEDIKEGFQLVHLRCYRNKDKKNRLMRIDELHKFRDGTLNDVRNALDDRLKGIRMQYLPSTIWRKGDKDGAAAMIQAIDKMLKTRRIMRSLEKFVGGRLYEGDLRMLQRTI
uniref:Uncharacterized protein n=1 Tax=Tanacetum cinerariifolium TaxID=118510 RepID=A0A6L2NT52_TANCI|nr:hypothetical protein [Tanacetum cinerariifolium]